MPEPSLELLQGLIQQVLDQVKLIRYEDKQLRRRISRVEQTTLDLRQEATTAIRDENELQNEIDGLAERVERLEERLAPQAL